MRTLVITRIFLALVSLLALGACIINIWAAAHVAHAPGWQEAQVGVLAIGMIFGALGFVGLEIASRPSR